MKLETSLPPRPLYACLGSVALLMVAAGASAATSTLRIASYNIEADVNGVTAPRSGLYASLELMGSTTVQGNAQPLDIVGLEETTSETATVFPIVTSLDTYYSGLATYAQTGVQGKEVNGDPTTGNGPNSLIYNTKTLTLLGATGVGTASGSSNGEYRQIMRYEFQPVTGSSADNFYLYVDHYKSGTTTSDVTARNQEAALVRNDELSLPSNARVIYTGDLNMSPGEAGYNTLTSATTTTQGQAIDPLNGAKTKSVDTDSSTSFKYRDDYELVTQPVLTDASGLKLVSGSYTTFGNTGGSSASFSSLRSASDHIPVFADYTYVIDPQGDLNKDGTVDIADLGILASNWQVSGVNVPGDINGDGTVNIGDLGILASNWQAGVNPPAGGFNAALAAVASQTGSTVPEPAVAMGAVAALLTRRPRRQVMPVSADNRQCTMIF